MSTSVSHEWISVDDRLPEEDAVVLMWRKAGFEYRRRYPSFPGSYSNGKWYDVLDEEGGIITGVTHWQPLPATRPAIPQPPASKPLKIDRG